MATCWAYDGDGTVCRRPAVGVDAQRGFTVCEYHTPPPYPFAVSRVARGDLLQVSHNGRAFPARVQGAWAVVKEGHPTQGWFRVILVLEDDQGRTWEWQGKALLDFCSPVWAHVDLSQPGSWMAVGLPMGQPLPVKPFKPPK